MQELITQMIELYPVRGYLLVCCAIYLCGLVTCYLQYKVEDVTFSVYGRYKLLYLSFIPPINIFIFAGSIYYGISYLIIWSTKEDQCK